MLRLLRGQLQLLTTGKKKERGGDAAALMAKTV